MTPVEALYTALHSPLGIIIAIEGSRDLYRAKLYTARKGDLMLECIAILASPVAANELWLVKKEPADAA